MLRVQSSRELQAAVLAFKGADRDLQSEIRRATAQTMNPVWRGIVQVNATTARDTRVLAQGARIRPGNPPTAIAATSRRRLSGGLVPVQAWQAFEFGADRNATTTYTRRSPGGGTHQVTRRTKRQLPPRIRTGRVVYPAFAEIAPRMVSLWVQLVVKKYLDAAERK